MDIHQNYPAQIKLAELKNIFDKYVWDYILVLDNTKNGDIFAPFES